MTYVYHLIFYALEIGKEKRKEVELTFPKHNLDSECIPESVILVTDMLSKIEKAPHSEFYRNKIKKDEL